MAKEIYVSVDIESDGPIPGEYSMLSFGAAAFSDAGDLLDTFSRNVIELGGARQNPETMEWWKTQPEAWEICHKDPVPADEAMSSFVWWLEALPGKPVCVCYPAGYDFTFIYWYLIKFAHRSPFGFQALDLKTFAMSRLGLSFRETSKKRMPSEWFGEDKHTHVAIDDAIEQGRLFFKMREHIAL